MKRLFVILLFAATFSAGDIYAQSVKSNVFSLDDLPESSVSGADEGIFMPPNLSVDIDFIDSDGSNILNALETAKIRLTIKNTGGDASNVKVTVNPEQQYKGLKVKGRQVLTNVLSGRSSTVEFPVSADIDLPTNKEARFNIKIYEPLGYDIEAVLKVPTMEFAKSKLIMNGVTGIADAGVGLMARNGNPDGKVQAGDIVSVNVLLQNIGVGHAQNVKYNIQSTNENVLLYTKTGPTNSLSGDLGDLMSGKTYELSFRLGANNRYVNDGGYLPVYITLTEEYGFGSLGSTIIPIPFDSAPIMPEVETVDVDMDKVLASLGKVEIESQDARVNSRPQIIDISIAPKGSQIHTDAIAVVLGTETYADKLIPEAPYAARDAKIMGEYFKTAMGIPNVNVLTDEDVTMMDLTMMFDPQRGKLSKMVQPGVTNLFIYYSGHGVPVESDGDMDVLLIPYDVEKAWIKDYGFSLNQMYKDLASLEAKSVTVILDACFSGGSRSSDKYKSESVANQKLVMLDESEMEQPWLNNPAFRVFTSSQGNQTSLGNDLSQSGLFTYYIALGLQGRADSDSNGSITLAELVKYVTDNVNKDSDGAQTPQFYGNGDFILEKIR